MGCQRSTLVSLLHWISIVEHVLTFDILRSALDLPPISLPSPPSFSPRTESWVSDLPTEVTCQFPFSNWICTPSKFRSDCRTHGAYTPKRKISSSSIYFQSLPYQVDPATGLIDYDTLEKNALLFKPRILICGASAYPRDWDYARLRKIADLNGSYLMSVLPFTL